MTMLLSPFNYNRRITSEVTIGNITIGGTAPIRVQSMANTDTNHVEASVAQAIRIKEAGGELVRFTTQGIREAQSMKLIHEQLRARGVNVPLVADIHFNPKVAEEAAQYIEKVRINPGNFVAGKTTDYTDEEFEAERNKIHEKLRTLISICKQHHKDIHIGVNHGSLSPRIMNRYGDTPEGLAASCMEFLELCQLENFHQIVISVKASNTLVMVQAVRLLVQKMDTAGFHFPLHLGVTEAGEGEDGRIKSAVGIGALLADGIGDTIRVSLSEEPEYEIPVARHLVDYIGHRAGHMLVPGLEWEGFDYLRPERRKTRAVMNIGGENLPVVIADRMDGGVRTSSEFTPDYIYCGRALPEKREHCAYIIDADMYHGEENTYPAFPYNQLPLVSAVDAPLKFLFLPFGAPSDEYLACLKQHPEIVVISQSNHQNRLGEQRALIHEFLCNGIDNPVVIFQQSQHSAEEKSDFQLEAAADMGPLMFDGLCDGVYLFNNGSLSHDDIDATAYGILQAARLRTVKTEYISCPGCGRTLYDLQDTIRRIKEATKEFKGLKIGIMGCIVNGPGEMADADYGYVGAARGKVSLYRRKECIEKNIPEEEAVEKLLQLIRSDMK